MSKRRVKVTCIICPIGCDLQVEISEKGEIISLSGNLCHKGEDYARKEVLNPKRVLISVVKVRGGDFPVVSVKTDKPIPKRLIREVLHVLSKLEVEAPINMGDVILRNVLGLNVSIIATRSVRRSTGSSGAY